MSGQAAEVLVSISVINGCQHFFFSKSLGKSLHKHPFDSHLGCSFCYVDDAPWLMQALSTFKEVKSEYADLLPGKADVGSETVKAGETKSATMDTLIQEGTLSTLLLDPKLSQVDRKKKLQTVMNKLSPETRARAHPRLIRESANQCTYNE